MTTRSVEAAFPLSPLQEGMLFHTIRAPDAGLFQVHCTGKLEGPVVREHFVRAWQLAAERHAAMRTFFSWEGRERPLQVVRARVSLDVELLDWTDCSAAEQGARWEHLLQRDRARGFDLAAAPLMRLTLVRTTPTCHRLLWAMHHALLDGWSALVVLDEVMHDYATLLAGGEPARGPAPRFDRFVGWLEGQDRARDEAYWRRTLAGFSGPVELPGGERLPRAGSDRVRTTHVLPAEASRQLQAAAARLRVTVNTLLMGAWAIMLARHAGRDDVLFGVTVSERPAEIDAVDGAVGLYLSTVPVRAPRQRGVQVGAWLRALQLTLSDARAHGSPGLAAIQHWSGLSPGTALFRSLVVFENFAEDAMRPFTTGGEPGRATGGTLELSSAAMSVPNDIPLVLLAMPGERFVLDVIHDPVVVPTDVAQRLPSHLAALLVEFAGAPERAVEELDMLDAGEQRVLRHEWSGADTSTPPARDVLARFEAHAATHADAIAVQTESASLSYGALHRWANRLAHRLHDAGVGEGALVGVLADRSMQAIAAMLAVLTVGSAYVPLDPRAPEMRLQQIVSSLDAVLADPQHARRLDADLRMLLLDDATSFNDSSTVQASAATVAHSDDANPAYVIFTSGSTGEPKGVVVERRQLAASNSARDIYYSEPPRTFLLLSPITVDSSVAGIFWTLGSGGTLVLPAARAEQDVEALARLAERTGVTHTLLVPSLYRALLEQADARRLASLRCVIVAGEACPARVVRQHHACLPHAALHNEYGPSEATVWATAGELTGREETPVTVGRPIPGARIYLLDDALRLVPAGSVGEICIGGATVARGYLGMPDETTSRFVPDPFLPGGRIYRTGDRGRFLPDGRIEFLGRADAQIKLRGFRVEPEEIERVIAGHPDVHEAAVALVSSSVSSEPGALVAALAALPPDEADRLLRSVEGAA